MSDRGTSVQLLQAIIDLKIVKSITSAIRANTLRRGGVEGPLGNIENPKPGWPGEFSVNPEPRYEPRRTIHPEPRFEPRAAEPCVIHHRTVERPALADLKQPLHPEETICSLPNASPLAPPWHLPLPIAQTPQIRIVKYELSTPDLICKGMLIDLFI